MKKFLLCLILIALGAGNASAQIFVEQGKVVHEISPGDNITGRVTVHNTSNEPINIRVYWEDFEYVPPYDGKKEFVPSGTSVYSFSKWSTVSPQDFALQPFTKKSVDYVINVPQDIAGGYYGALFFEKEASDLQTSRGISMIVRVGSLFFLEPQNKVKDGRFTGWSASGGTLTGQFENRGNVILIPKGVYYVLDPDGMAVDRGEIEKIYLPPDGVKTFSVNLDPSIKAGRYTVVVTFDLNEGDVLVQELDVMKQRDGEFRVERVRD